MTARMCVVYRAYDADGNLLYVGATCDPDTRWRNHQRGSAWARRVVRFRVAGPYPELVARQLERAAIEAEGPLYNQHHTGRPLTRRPPNRKLNGATVKAMREARGWGLRKFSEIIGRNAGFMSRVERGIDNASPATIVRIADALQVPLDAISSGTAA